MVLFSQAAGGSLPEKLCDGKTKICLKKVVMIRVNSTIQKVLTRNNESECGDAYFTFHHLF